MLWIAVTLPLLPLEAVRPPRLHAMPPPSETAAESGPQPPAGCHALADRLRILVPDFDALHCGVHAGITRSHALALAPGLVLLDPDPARETRALEALALALLAYTPQVSFAPSHTLLLEVGSGLRLFGGLRALLARVTETAAGFGYVVRVACAPTAWGAWLLAQARVQRAGRRWHAVRETTLARVLDALPVSLAPFAAEHGLAFEQIGCATLADLRRLPRAGVARRFGDGVLDWLAQAYGEAPDPREPFRAPPSFHAELELQARVDNAQALLFAARRLVMQLAGWLAARQLALRAFELRFEHELATRRAPRASSLKVAWSAPSRDADHLLWLLREQLDQTALAAPVIGLKLVAREMSACAAPSGLLFPLPEAQDALLAQLFERLGARVGAQNVLQLSAGDDHRPERAMQLGESRVPARQRGRRRTADDAARQAPSAAGPPVGPGGGPAQATLDLPEVPLPSLPRPVWLLERPLKLAMRGQRPVYRRPLKTLTRPERIESGWWDGEGVERDYYVAADDRGRMFWVYRERSGGQWFLQGLFG
ncbi:UMUC domain-containing protein DNA-repair protein [Burkholderia sp. WAC0059]|uniref:Y-family DNA polymerase n=1 Tax=Burkholderia sp. WAC0059 TaxID=2066022 RepID=UPI000C7F6C4F|nr:DNA polymerase Y family protein [Burkholderia sp. WAC0059]PLZ03024.1 UMUC domain-containing protein DNA-repair protein [Burkholderia sp. WAC0059]